MQTIIAVAIVVVVVVILGIIARSIWLKKRIKDADSLLEGGSIIKQDDFFKKSYMIGGDSSYIPDSIRKYCLSDWPKVGVISNYLLQKIPLESFVYLEKTDGIHANILIHDGRIYDVTNSEEIKQVGTTETKATLVLDTENYENKYYVFDAYVVDNEIVNEKHFEERMKLAEPFVKELGDRFEMKTFKPVPSIEFLIEYVKNDRSPDTGNEIDGVVLQRTDTPYLPGPREVYVYKMKPSALMTTDLLLKYQEKEKCYKLYTRGKRSSYFNLITQRPRNEKYIYDLDGHVYERSKLKSYPEEMLILFDTPYYPNLGVYEISDTWNSKGFFKRNIDAADQIISELVKYPDALDGKIVEMALTEDHKWVPIRVRTDKNGNPNGILTGLSCVEAVFDPIRPKSDIYFQKGSSLTSDQQTFVHELNGIYRRFIIETHINPIGKFATVIDLCGGRGADIFDMYCNGVTNFFAIDADRTALAQYVFRCSNAKYSFKQGQYKPLLRQFRNNVYDNGNPISVNVLAHELGKSYSDVITDLKSRYEWKGSCKVVLMNFAIHYLCTSQANIDALGKFVKNVLDDNGIFIITYFEGDTITSKAEKDEAHIGPFNIKIRQVRRVVHAKMPLVTFRNADNDMYVEEPLVMADSLIKLDSHLEKIADYNAYERCKTWADRLAKTKEYKALLDYYKLVHVRVYKKK